MSSFWQDLAIAYRPAAVSRRKQIALRLFVVLVLAAMAMIRPGAGFIFPWAAVYLVVQIAEWAALNRFLRKAEPSGLDVSLSLVADCALAAVFGWRAGMVRAP